MLEALKRNESFEYQKLSPEEMKARGILGRLVGPCADFMNATRNGRGYGEDLWENVFNDDIVKEKIENKCLYGELGHPADREEVDMEKIAISMPELPKKDKDGHLVACFDILDTPSGRILKTLCDYGTTIGISSRGSGDVIEDDDGNEIVDPSTYTFECFDAVIVPAVKDARLQYVTEDLDRNQFNMKKALRESLESASEEDRKVMTETLHDLNINVEEPTEQSTLTNVSDDNTLTLEQTQTDAQVANNDGTENIIKSLQEALKSNLELEAKVATLQNEIAVRDTKVNKLEEDISRSKSTIVRLTTLAKESKEKTKRISTLEEELQQSKEKITSLTNSEEEAKEVKPLKESLSKKEDEVSSLNEQLHSLKATHESEVRKLNESIATLKKEKEESTRKEKQLSENLNKSKVIIEKYKTFSNNIAQRYIEVRAKNLGVKKDDIMNRLSNNYSLEEIDKVCEELRRYRLNLSKLPFTLDNKSVVKINESKHIGINTQDVVDDDYIGEDTLRAAGLK